MTARVESTTVATNATTAPVAVVHPRFRSNGAADRLMRRLLGVAGHAPPTATAGSTAAAHRAFRTSVVVSGIRCLVTYVLVPLLLPLLSLAGWLAAPIGLALCALALVTGVVSLRRFWGADHPHRWMYTAFVAVVFVILGAALVSDLTRLGVMA